MADSAPAVDGATRSTSTVRSIFELAPATAAATRTVTYSRDVADSAPAIDSAGAILPPVITILSENPPKISKIAGFNTATVVWSSDSDLDRWELHVVPLSSSPHDAGTQIPTTAGSTTAGNSATALIPVTSLVKGADLETASPGDGAKLVKVFGRATGGPWSA